MTNTEGNTITSMQFIFIISGIQISVAVLNLPRNLAELAGTDGWISILIGYALSVLCGYIIIMVMRHCSGKTLVDALPTMMGKWIAKGVAILLALFFLTLMYDGLVRTILIIKIWLMPNTQSYILMVLLLVPAYKIAINGPRILGRYAELVAVISCWLPFVYLFTLKYAHWLNLLPILKEGWLPVLAAVKATIYPNLGLAAVFIFYPYLVKKEKAASSVFISSTITLSVHLFITIICFIYFSPHEITLYNEPIISILKTIEFRFIERIEVPFIAFYLFVFSLVWIPSMYIVTYCISKVFGLSNHHAPLRILCIILAIATFIYIPSFKQSDEIEVWLTWFGFGMEYILPSLLLVYMVIYKRIHRRAGL
ncbi:GerAB/ArcD/ProY family transporter [Bacillus sp. FJAT-28004]|uniref:GerAB/ArcD/ProY family transporter n=1 Tax=Bacillus sp. FJAT-28004 TaxID=1679165 RepID=UPI000A88043A|nr:endospore germination permease [Bacillus sp. FJAT-28004]